MLAQLAKVSSRKHSPLLSPSERSHSWVCSSWISHLWWSQSLFLSPCSSFSLSWHWLWKVKWYPQPCLCSCSAGRTAVNKLTRHQVTTSSSCDAGDFPWDREESLTFHLKVLSVNIYYSVYCTWQYLHSSKVWPAVKLLSALTDLQVAKILTFQKSLKYNNLSF